MDHIYQFIGRLHPLVVHIPIGIIFLAVGLEFLASKKRYHFIAPVLPLVWGAGFIGAVISCFAGWFLQMGGEYEAEALFFHQYAGISLAVFSGIMYFIKLKQRYSRFHLPAALSIGALLAVTGHLGGSLTHGEDYLSQPILALMGKGPVEKNRQPITDINQAVVFHDLIDPILEENCYRCHSHKKQKGKLRLDAPDFILKGGKNGKILSAGNLDKSELYQRLILPEGDDKRMPPKGKPQLTKEEIEVIKWWIAQGQADFDVRVVEVMPDEKMKSMLASWSPEGENSAAGSSGTSSTMIIPDVPVTQPKKEYVESLQQMGIIVSYLTPEKTFVSVNLINNPSFSDEQAKALINIADQIVWLDVSGTRISDHAMKEIGKLKNLTRLRLDKTNITDAGLLQLKNSKNLVYLNLYGTAITDKGLELLKDLKNLRAIYLWQSKVTPEGVAKLKQEFGPNVEINNGIEL